MISIKSEKEIEIMRFGGKILAEVLSLVLEHVKPGVSELELDEMAEKLILQKGGAPGFKKVKGYNHTICVSTNDAIVHGIPGEYRFKEGDIVGIDCGVYYKGFHTDMAETRKVLRSKNNDDNVDKFIEIGKIAVEEAIKIVAPGNRIGHISKTIQDIVEKKGGYSVVRSLIGHGVGRELHEEPEVPGFLVGEIEKTPILKPGMTIAIEAIYNMGDPEVALDQDGWTIRTRDGSLSGLYERTILITDYGSEVLTA